MDSVDSGCTMGARDSSGSPAMALGSELIVWEIEVPKVSLLHPNTHTQRLD